MAGGYVLCEWHSVRDEFPEFQATFAALEADVILKCSMDWSPRSFGYMAPRSDQYGRTTILPALFDPNPNTYNGAQFGGTAVATYQTPPAYWRQAFTQAGHQTLIQGCRTGEGLPEDWKVAWLGLAFPNKQQHITEVRWQIGDRKFGRINLEEMHAYNKPALIFEDGYVIDGETAFHLYGFFEGPIPALAGPGGANQPGIPTVNVAGTQTACLHQRIVMLGAAYYKQSDRALGNCGAAV